MHSHVWHSPAHPQMHAAPEIEVKQAYFLKDFLYSVKKVFSRQEEQTLD